MKNFFLLFLFPLSFIASTKLFAQTLSCNNPTATYFEEEICGDSSNNIYYTAEQIQCGDFVIGYTWWDTNHYPFPGDIDHYSFTITQPSLVTFDIVSTTAVGVDLNFSQGPYTLSVDPCIISSAQYSMPAGTYWFAIYSNGGVNDIPCSWGPWYNFHLSCGPPCNLSATITSVNPCPSNLNGGSATVNVSGGVQPVTISWSNGATTQTINNLSAGPYTVYVTDANGCTATANVTLTNTSCAAPVGSPVSNITSSSAKINWAATTCAVSYDILIRPTGTSAWTTYNVLVPNTSKIITGLSPSTQYDWRMRTWCSSTSHSAYTAVHTFTTLTSCATPTNVTATNVTANSATVSWSSVTNAAKYQLRIRKTGTTAWTNYNINATSTSKTVYGLLASTAYQYQVRTKCTNGGQQASAYSTLQSLTTTLRLENISDVETAPVIVYPNPGSGNFMIEVKHENETSIHVSVYNLTGGLVYENQFENLSVNSPVQMQLHLPDGIYFAQIRTGTGTQLLKLVIEK